VTSPARLVVVSGPSGVGKGTVIGELLRRRPGLWLSVSTTTRAARPGEQDGRNYFFVSEPEFQELVERGGFLEWARYDDNWYGTARRPVEERLAAGQSVLLEIDLAGARQIQRSHPGAIRVFLAPPSEDELERRLLGRGTESPDVAARRLERAKHELAAQSEFDHVIVNSDVSRAVNELLQLLDSPDPAL
jgi:guanylate kinase